MVNQRFATRCITTTVVLLLLSIPVNRAQIPTIACPNYFRYYSDGTNYFGKITLPSVRPGNTKLEVHLSQIGPVSQTNPSSLSFYESQRDTTDKILNGRPVEFRVDFPVPNALPKLTLISVNDAAVCSDQDYPAPSTKIKLINNFDIRIKTLITPFVVGENSSGAEMANSFHHSDKPAAASPSKYFHNPFLSGQWNNHPTPPARVFNANPSNMFLHQPTTVQKTTNLSEVCGREGTVMTPLIRGGTVLNRGEFPWLTAVYRKQSKDLKFICGGSLISAKTVVSAAHCFLEPRIDEKKVLVLLGRNNLEALDEEGSEHCPVKSLLLHPEYTADAISDADIALIQLKRPVTFTRYIAPICLWNTATDISNIVGNVAYTAGWGADETGNSVTEQPKKIETYIADESACKQSLGEYQTMISSRTICVRAPNDKGPCTGDSGGGLALYTAGRWTLRGIVSAGLTRQGKCFSHEYYYFCDIGKHMNWILRNMWA